MEAPPGAFQRSVVVAVPLALVVLIVVTPGLLGRDRPATAIPILFIEAFGETGNETVLLYVRSGLGITRYAYLAINVTGLDAAGTKWTNSTRDAPSLWLKFPAAAARVSQIDALAVEETDTFRYAVTLEVVSDQEAPILRVTSEGIDTPREFRGTFSSSMTREAEP